MTKRLRNNLLIWGIACLAIVVLSGVLICNLESNTPNKLVFNPVWTGKDRQQIEEIYVSMKATIIPMPDDPFTLEDLTSSMFLSKFIQKKNQFIRNYRMNGLLRIIFDTASSGNARHSGESHMTLLHYACCFGKNELALYLLELGAAPNQSAEIKTSMGSIPTENGPTPLSCALSSWGQDSHIPVERRLDLIRILANHGADLNKKANGLVPFEEACLESHNEQIACLILSLGADPALGGNYPSYKKASGVRRNPLCIPIMHGCSEVVRMMLEKGIDPNETRGENPPLFITTGHYSDLVIKRLLLEHGADPNVRWKEPDDNPLDPSPEYGRTPLCDLCDHIFPRQNDDKKEVLIKSIELLLEYKALVNRASHDGETPLMMACRHLIDQDGNLNPAAVRVIRLLLKHDADVSLKNLKGDSAVTYILPASEETSRQLQEQLPELFQPRQ